MQDWENDVPTRQDGAVDRETNIADLEARLSQALERSKSDTREAAAVGRSLTMLTDADLRLRLV